MTLVVICNLVMAPVDISAPLWDLTTFTGRLKHFFWVTDYRTVLTPRSRLEEARKLVEDAKFVFCLSKIVHK